MSTTTRPSRTRASTEKRSCASAILIGLGGTPSAAVSWISTHAHQPAVAVA